MNRFVPAICAFFAVLAVQALEITVTPTSMDWNSNDWVNISVSNLTPGAEVRISLFVDADQTRSLSAKDVPIFSAALRDGASAPWGATYLLGDVDGLTNGSVQTRISYHGVDSMLHTIGSYLWVAATNMAEPVATPFAIVQDTSTVWIVGTVRRIGAPSEGIAGARVQLAYSFRSDGIEPAVWCNTSGAFQIFLPTGVGTSALKGVLASSLGCISAIQEPSGEWFSAYPFTAPLQIGANVLTSTLWVADAYSDEIVRVSGRVLATDGATTNPVPFALIRGEPDDEGEWWSVACSDVDGFFSMALPSAMPAWLLLTPGANMQGLASELVQLVVTQDMSNVLIRCYSAESLVRGRCQEAETGLPVPGSPVFAFNEELGVYGLAYAMGDGSFEISALHGVDHIAGIFLDDVLQKLGYVKPPEITGFAVDEDTPYTNVVFEMERAFPVRGRVFDQQTNALAWGMITAFASNSWEDVDEADVNFDGAYELSLPSGEYRVMAHDFDGYLSMVWSNHFTWEWSNGPVYDAILVTGATVSGVDFYLPRASYIRGQVLGEGVPLTGVYVSARINYQYINGAETRSNGTYEIPVPGGTSYYVKADPPSGSFWVPEYYDDVIGPEEVATPVYTDPSTPATNIDFDLTLGGRIEGQLFDADGFSPLPFSGFVEALDASMNFVNGAWSDPVTGGYGFAVPPGTYTVRMTAEGRLTRYYDGFFEYQQNAATPVTVAVASTRGNVNFVALPPSEVRGRVFSGASGVSDAVINIWYVLGTNTWMQYLLGSALSDGDGNYSALVPPGSNFAAHVWPPSHLGFSEQWWSNAADIFSATLFTVGPSSTVSNVDFELRLEMLSIVGRVTDQFGAGVSNVSISAWFEEGSNFVWAGGTATGSDGVYALSLSTSRVYRVGASRPHDVPAEEWWYPDVYYDGVFRLADALPLWTNAGQTVSNVNFQLLAGYHITGMVVRAVDGGPITFAEVQTFYGDLSTTLQSQWAGPEGAFMFCVPTNAPIYLRADAFFYGSRYYSNVAFGASAQAVHTSAYAIVPVEFRLVAYDEDVDGDGFNEYDEVWVAGTDPLSSNDYLKCVNAMRAGDGFTIEWDSVVGVSYYVERATNLASGIWTEIAGPISGTGGELSVTDTNAPSDAAYRILIIR